MNLFDRLPGELLIEEGNVRGFVVRHLALNGLGLSAADAEIQSAGFEAKFPL